MGRGKIPWVSLVTAEHKPWTKQPLPLSQGPPVKYRKHKQCEELPFIAHLQSVRCIQCTHMHYLTNIYGTHHLGMWFCKSNFLHKNK